MFMSEGRRERGGRESDGDREIEKLKESDRERERETEVAGREGKEKSRGGRTYMCIRLACCPCSLLSFSAGFFRLGTRICFVTYVNAQSLAI